MPVTLGFVHSCEGCLEILFLEFVKSLFRDLKKKSSVFLPKNTLIYELESVFAPLFFFINRFLPDAVYCLELFCFLLQNRAIYIRLL